MDKITVKKDYSTLCLKEMGVPCDGGVDCKTRCTPRPSMCAKCWCSQCTKGKC